MKVLLLGGTGAMGSHLASLLANNGVLVTVTSRRALVSHDNIRYLYGNAHDKSFLADVLSERWDVIVDFMVYDTVSFVNRIKKLLAATAQYIFVSSARVYADSSTPITEASPRLLDTSKDKEFLASDEYALQKARQEDCLFQSAYNNWTIIRPYITYNETRLQLGVLEKEGWLYRAMRGQTIIFSSDMAKKKTTVTYGLDVACGIRSILGRSSALGEAFNITIDNHITWDEVLSIYLNVFEQKFNWRPEVSFKDLDHFCLTHKAIYQIRYDRLFNRVFDNTKIKQYLDTSSFVVPEVGLKMCLEDFLAEPSFKPINWRAEAARDRLTGEYSLCGIAGAKNKLKYIVRRHLIY